MGGTVPIRGFQPITDLTVACERQSLLRHGGAANISAQALEIGSRFTSPTPTGYLVERAREVVAAFARRARRGLPVIDTSN